jgi:hypothetical protein
VHKFGELPTRSVDLSTRLIGVSLWQPVDWWYPCAAFEEWLD